MIKSIKDLDLHNKKIFMRVDFNVPIKNGEVTDDTRIREAAPTIQYAISKGAKIALFSHLGRPKGEKKPEFSLRPVAHHIVLENIFGKEFSTMTFIPDCIDDSIENEINSMPAGSVTLMENLRFYPGEEKNDIEFTKQLAKPFDIYINDAFGSSHRKHASVYGVPEIIKDKATGFLLEKEITYFDKFLKNPDKPVAAIIGGAKVSDKIGVIKSLMGIADVILIGGAMAYTFLKYQGISVGSSLVENEEMDTVREVLEKADKSNVKILLPKDHIISDIFGGKPKECGDINIPDGFMGLDIGKNTISNFSMALANCKSILWNGPMGVFENPDYADGTFSIARKIASLNATTIVGGGDSVSAVKKSGMADKISHISTGGGASLEYIEYGSLPGIEVLRD